MSRLLLCCFVLSSLVASRTWGEDEIIQGEFEVVLQEAVAEIEEAKPEAVEEAPEKKPADAKKDEAKPEAVVEPDRTPAAPVDPLFLRLHLEDGSLLAGKLSIKEITVTTAFGELVIPIEKIRSFEPGLNSSATALAELEKLLENLGSDDYKTREAAHKELAAMGPRIRLELQRKANDPNPEIKRHVTEILKALEEEAESYDEESSAPKPWIREDTVTTGAFTVVGKISPPEFAMQSKYGTLQVALADIRLADRPLGEKEALHKSLSVSGDNVAQRGFKSSGIRVEAGDRILVKAEGTMVMTPWGSNSIVTPDGAANYGWYVPNDIPGGALVAKIGDRGSVFKVGKQLSFVAKNSGILQFGVGIQADYAGEGYNFPGEYKLKIKVEPK